MDGNHKNDNLRSNGSEEFSDINKASTEFVEGQRHDSPVDLSEHKLNLPALVEAHSSTGSIECVDVKETLKYSHTDVLPGTDTFFQIDSSSSDVLQNRDVFVSSIDSFLDDNSTVVSEVIVTSDHQELKDSDVISEILLESDTAADTPELVIENGIIDLSETNSYLEPPATVNLSNEVQIVHTVQQGAAVQRKTYTSSKGRNDNYVEVVDLTEDDFEETQLPDTLDDFTKNTRLCIMLDVLPDADVEFLSKKVNEIKSDKEMELFVRAAVEYQNYPKKETDNNTKKNRLYVDTDLILGEKSAMNVPASTQVPTISQSSTLNESYVSSVDSIDSRLPTRRLNADYGNILDLKIRPPARHVVSGRSLASHTVTSGTATSAADTTAFLHTSPQFPDTGTIYPGFRLSSHSHTGIQPTIANHTVKRNVKPHTVTSHRDALAAVLPETVTSTTPVQGMIVTDNPRIEMVHHSLVFPPAPPTVAATAAIRTDPRGVNRRRHRHTMIPHVPQFRLPPMPFLLPGGPRLTTVDRGLPWDLLDLRERGLGGYTFWHMDMVTIPQAMAHHEINDLDDAIQNLSVETSATPPTVEDQRFNLLADILFYADLTFLRNEAKKIKTDEDLEKFLVLAFASDEMWRKNVTDDGKIASATNDKKRTNRVENKYKILLELLPDASPMFLKREAAKLKNDLEVQEFAMKLSREQKYPKRKGSATSPQGKRKQTESSDPGPVDPKYQSLLDMLPDADPDFLLKESKRLENEEDLQAFVLKAVEDNTYPKRYHFLERQEFYKQWQRYIENFDIKDFLQLFPNPMKYFYIDKVNSKSPFDVPVKFLQHRYRRKNGNDFGIFYKVSKQNLTKTCDRLDANFPVKPRKYVVWDQETIFPTTVLQEIAFIQNKKEIAHYILFKDKQKSEAYEKAKTEGTLQECGCCYDEKLSEDMVSCGAGHIFCLNCIKRGSEVVIGNGGTSFPCYSDNCEEEFSFNILQSVLNKEVFSRLMIRKQYEEVNAAGIPGLETCNFCEFCSIPPAEDKLFHCLNPSCMKITCRACKELDHLPLSCEESKKKNTEMKMKSYVEDQMTEALVRTCWQCGTKFVKENGCNMMTCKCGARMCYFCREPIKDYKHFETGWCGKILDTTTHDEAAIIRVGKEAKMEMEAANPGFELSTDPTALHQSHEARHGRRRNTHYPPPLEWGFPDFL